MDSLHRREVDSRRNIVEYSFTSTFLKQTHARFDNEHCQLIKCSLVRKSNIQKSNFLVIV